MSRRSQRGLPSPNIPKYTIDLSLLPRERYRALALTYNHVIQGITPLFNQLLGDLGIREKYHPSINRMAGLLLRGVHSQIETAELKGIAEVTGLSMYLLVAFNVVLDLLMGCTSGGVRSTRPGRLSGESSMLHFRTLDWGMDPLREIIVQLEFVRSKSKAPDEVVARSVTYVGYVGVLTGVRPNLSMSLNFRPMHNTHTRSGHFRFYFHHLLVLLGLRPSISSILRSYLFNESESDGPTDLTSISSKLAPQHTTAAYLIFSDGETTMTMEKDYGDAVTRKSSNFIVITNHDRDWESPQGEKQGTEPGPSTSVARLDSLRELLDESQERKECIGRKWRKEVWNQTRQSRRSTSRVEEEVVVAISEAEAIRWVSDWPTTNETTHYAVVMDPKEGQVVWGHAYAEPPVQPA
jgi:beta subunit of N-acylethanolamine-hydrolyzing acid amidase